ncbi:MAG: hypothetical protein LH679_05350 [Cyanobacteria bacterium CAN_BIN43]|nr:hypothetical protein [Cyanobacteria bacterium CAN_BIN43]
MSDAQLDSFPVSELQHRYKIVRSAVYTRLEALNIKSEKQRGRAYVNGDQLKLLDALHDHLEKGGTTSEFVASLADSGQQHLSRGQIEKSSGQQDLSSGQVGQFAITEQHSALAGLIEAIASRLMPMIASQLKPAPDPLASLRGLEEAYRNTWLLSTSELAQLLKLSPKTVRSYGDQFEDAGFVFTRAGTRKRGEVAWKISKLGE